MLKFTKMHGLGNDFMVIDAIHQDVQLDASQVKRLADRHFGIGFDQLLLVEAPTDKQADFRYRIFNADGGEVSQCGNGARCFARFVYEAGLSDKKQIAVETNAGLLVLLREENGQVTVNMGIPRHSPAQIPLQISEEQLFYSVPVEGQILRFGAVSIGNPHAVVQVDDIDTAPVNSLGPILEGHPLFPQRANIGFLQILNPHRACLRVFERGSGETLACGSGACAAAVVGIEQNLLADPVQIDLPGGSLDIRWQGRGQPVYMTGPAVTVFEGMIEI